MIRNVPWIVSSWAKVTLAGFASSDFDLGPSNERLPSTNNLNNRPITHLPVPSSPKAGPPPHETMLPLAVTSTFRQLYSAASGGHKESPDSSVM